MIRVDKPLTPPPVLTGRGKTAATTHIADYGKNPSGYQSGAAHFVFAAGIYAHDTVKEALRVAQHDKCAFCECKISHTQHGDVEHYRPKAAVRQKAGEPLTRPGYYWLAYEWDNLFLACQLCNQVFKENLFPIRTPKNRARSHHDDVTREKPLLLHPSAQDIDRHLTFSGPLVVPVGASRHGRATIKVLGLNRPKMVDARHKWLRVLEAAKKAHTRLTGIASDARTPADVHDLAEIEQLIADCTGPSAQFSAMARVLFST
ncbi:MAG TPA: hypothetical protein VD866_27330 [Urbifossiella sp.]|nr:hypothetical protein [Urbifossiella sp.]